MGVYQGKKKMMSNFALKFGSFFARQNKRMKEGQLPSLKLLHRKIDFSKSCSSCIFMGVVLNEGSSI